MLFDTLRHDKRKSVVSGYRPLYIGITVKCPDLCTHRADGICSGYIACLR